MPVYTPREGAFNDNDANIWDQQVPFDFASGFSGQWVLGPLRIDQSTGDITNDTGIGQIVGFAVGSSGTSGFSGFSGQGFSGPSGESGFSGIGFSGFSGISGAGTAMFHQFILIGA